MIGGGGGVRQIMTVDDQGEGGWLAYLVRPDDVISGQPLSFNNIFCDMMGLIALNMQLTCTLVCITFSFIILCTCEERVFSLYCIPGVKFMSL